MSADEYDVGYRKPPKATRFKKGQSGNPKGRPKGSPNIVTAVRRAIHAKVPIIEEGRRKLMSKLDAAATQLANKAAKGDQRAIDRLLAFAPLLDDVAGAQAGPPLEEADEQVADLIVKRIRASKDDDKKRGGGK
jgi:hypothetical protein